MLSQSNLVHLTLTLHSDFLHLLEKVVVAQDAHKPVIGAEGFKAVMGDWDGMRLGQGICNYFHNTLHHLHIFIVHVTWRDREGEDEMHQQHESSASSCDHFRNAKRRQAFCLKVKNRRAE